jgi:hypothetical protein
MKQYLKWILNVTLFGDVFIDSNSFNAMNVFFKYFQILSGRERQTRSENTSQQFVV